ncbi:D-ribose pyranase [Chitinimonas sp.]|uniref:D-ribose pyranase n=1 Tax=Chitinimonas sp. TaxID=1934313 RepID=UPI002F9593F9
MKRTPLLNSALSEVIATLGHGDMLVIGDAGLPIPAGPQRIDLAITRDLPRFVDVLEVVLSEMQVENVVVASELAGRNPAVAERIPTLLGTTPVTAISHEEFKLLTRSARAVVRTGECSPYANIILRAGVVF